MTLHIPIEWLLGGLYGFVVFAGFCWYAYMKGGDRLTSGASDLALGVICFWPLAIVCAALMLWCMGMAYLLYLPFHPWYRMGQKAKARKSQ